MTINGIALAIGIIIGILSLWCGYWMGRNDEREMWEREKRNEHK